MHGRRRGRDPSRRPSRCRSGIDHVHCYFLRSSNGGWILVDTGLGSRDPEERWRPVLDELDAPIERDRRHAHASRPRRRRARHRRAHGRAGAPGARGLRAVRRGVGRAQPAAVRRLLGLARHAARDGRRASRASRSGSSTRCTGSSDPQLLDAGDEIDGWRVEVLPGHADGHIVLAARRRDDRGRHDPRRDHAGDRALSELTARPARRLPRDAGPDRGARAAGRLRRPQGAVLDPAGRAREISAHHARAARRHRGRARRRRRSRRTTSRSRSSTTTFSPTLRRFATAESLAHLERLVREAGLRAPGSAYVSA